MHQHHHPSPTTPCFRKSFSKSGQVRFDNSFAEYSLRDLSDILNLCTSSNEVKIVSIRGELTQGLRFVEIGARLLFGLQGLFSEKRKCTCWRIPERVEVLPRRRVVSRA